ncbi:molybdopterin synthase sulfurylase [Phakopsora pachyrhizi]|nr:molybdopterin synthase sulfurylase [Phakopsora pachyrhizi]
MRRSTELIIDEIIRTRIRLEELQDELIKTSNENQKSLLNLDEFKLYGRQMILSDVGLRGQIKLKSSSVLVIGAGGLGCPALLYLSRAGIGKISIVDNDVVEVSNLHRQVLHSTSTVGMNKAESAKLALRSGNSFVEIKSYTVPFTERNIRNKTRRIKTDETDSKIYLPDLDEFDIVLDCTDNPKTRYLISDACVANRKTLVSGACIRVQGQLSTWNLDGSSDLNLCHGERARGPCYRCVFEEDVGLEAERCSDEGVMGPIVGLVGILMAWETLKILLKIHDLKPKLLLIPSFRTVKLRGSIPNCKGCGKGSEERFWDRIDKAQSSSSSSSFEDEEDEKGLTGCERSDCHLRIDQEKVFNQIFSSRLTTKELLTGKRSLDDFHLIDIRNKTQFEICSIPNSINVPFEELTEFSNLRMIQQMNLDRDREEEISSNDDDVKKLDRRRKDYLMICRRGVDSLIGAKIVSDHLLSNLNNNQSKNLKDKSNNDNDKIKDDDDVVVVKVFDLQGGLKSYSEEVDMNFPIY